MNMTE